MPRPRIPSARILLPVFAAAAIGALLLLRSTLPPLAVSFSASASDVEAYAFVEITATVSPPHAANPFTDGSIRATFQSTARNDRWHVDGFADAEDGSVYRVRFMPPAAGDYTYSVEYRQGWSTKTFAGTFRVRAASRRGPIRVDPKNRWHFVWEGTGEHYFFHGVTAYWLAGWTDDRVIESIIERFHRLKINRVRVTVAGRTHIFYGEPVMVGRNWTSFLEPWPAGRGQRYLHYVGRLGQRAGLRIGRSVFDALSDLGNVEDLYHPGFDYSRFRVAHWQKLERALRYARDRDIIFSLVLDMNDSRAHAAPGSEDERRFIRYAIARFGAFSNVTWDLGDDLDSFRDDSWTHATGSLVKSSDPYRHLATSHPVDNVHQDRTSDWFDFTSFQDWSRTQHTFMLAQRRAQEKLGRIIPQTNEEYGYEDHYPMWALPPDADSPDVLRRMAWEIVMAGGYQTTGETARRGTNVWPNTGGGWLNGRGDASMTMLEGYGHMVDFFTSFSWWDTEPHDELVSRGNYCLAKPGEIYAIYLPRAARVRVRLVPGRYRAEWWSAATGERSALPIVEEREGSWQSPDPGGSGDWALLLRKTN